MERERAWKPKVKVTGKEDQIKKQSFACICKFMGEHSQHKGMFPNHAGVMS